MLFKLLELVFVLIEKLVQDASIIVKLFMFFEQLFTVIGDTIGTALPELLGGVLVSSLSMIVVLKLIQFH